MTTDIEKTFFDTFGIEPKYRDYRTKNGKIYDNKNPQNRNIRLCYPQITEHILLNLILIMNPYAPPVGDTMEEMKEQVLYWCTQYAKKIKHKVQALFKEG